MNDETRHLMYALSVVNHKVPDVVPGFMEGTLSTEKQAEFGGLLIELGELVRWHAWQLGGLVVEGAASRCDEPPARHRPSERFQRSALHTGPS